jgi:hypothetical protein
MKKNLLLTGLLLGFMQLASAQTLQKVVIEEFTGAWCGYCPDGATILDNILTNQPNAIGVSVHNSDAMQNGTGSLITNFYSPAFPQATINRSGAPISRGSWTNAVSVALQATPVVSVSIDSAGYDFQTRALTVKVKATFLSDYTGTMRMNVLLTEDDVTGTGSGYDQVNYFNSTVGSPYYGLGNPIVGFVHNHVFRASGGNAWGSASVIPSSVATGEEFSKTYSIILGANWDINNMHIVGTVNHFTGSGMNQRSILNAEEVPFSIATALNPSVLNGDLSLEIAPNPVSGRSTIGFSVNEAGRVQLEVFSLTGQKIRVLADDFTNTGMHSVYWDGTDASGSALANGLYLLRLRTESGATISKRVMVNN